MDIDIPDDLLLTSNEEKHLKEWLRLQPSTITIQEVGDFLVKKHGRIFYMKEIKRLVRQEKGNIAASNYANIIAYMYATRYEHTERLAVPVYGDDPLTRPGFGQTLNYLPFHYAHFPVLMCEDGSGWAAATLLIREVCMLKVINELTDKPEWWRKVHDPAITKKWKAEALSADWSLYREHGDFTPAMADACINEVQKKAELYQQKSLIPVYDYSACVLKSDSLLPDDLRQELMAAVAPLENVPDDEKDYHPGSDEKVLDLVHPSLWPLIYGRTRILSDKRINVKNCLNHGGLGDVIPRPHPDELRHTNKRYYRHSQHPSLSPNFQWLPCDVSLDEEGRAKIDSYINNLHPLQHTKLYSTIEKFIAKALPAWDAIYRWPGEFQCQRLSVSTAGPRCDTPDICGTGTTAQWWECQRWNRPINDDEPPRAEYEHSEPDYDYSTRAHLDLEWFRVTHPTAVPDAPTQGEHGVTKAALNNDHDEFFHLSSSDIKASSFFNGVSRIQIIVKLANIQLTPDKPTFGNSSWHIEGQLNEHICATALFYYDSDNITDSHLAFRTSANRESLLEELTYDQDDRHNIVRTFAIDPNSTIQDIGSVLTRPGRALFFPNVYQHRVQPFQLADPSRPGHRKILALFLVDPAIPIISTANVPPQQRHWWFGDEIAHKSSLPTELTDLILSNIDNLIDEDEAKEVRKELMAERTVLQTDATSHLQRIEFNFCEH